MAACCHHMLANSSTVETRQTTWGQLPILAYITYSWGSSMYDFHSIGLFETVVKNNTLALSSFPKSKHVFVHNVLLLLYKESFLDHS